MTEPYRTSGLACPHCPGASLREFQARYVCDECDGLLIGFADLASAIADLRDEETKFEYADETPVDVACPVCERKLVECRVRLVFPTKTIKVRDTFLRCERDGLWCGSGVLATIFAKVVRRWGGGPSYDNAFQVGLDGLPLNRRGAAVTDGLRISNWRDRPRRRTKTLTPVNAYADRDLHCPACATTLLFQGDRWACASCSGAFIEDAALVALVEDMTNAPWEMPPVIGDAGPHACPVCREAMCVERFTTVDIDRCIHGVWFDATELATALEHVIPPHGLATWLKRAFFQ